MRVAVYFNLHKNIFSVQSREKETYGRVIDHVKSVVLKAPKFVVRQAGRKKVIQDKKKNVHAFVVGYIADGVETLSKEEIVTYNPYKYTGFVKEDTKEEVSKAEYSVIRFGVDGKPLISAYGA